MNKWLQATLLLLLITANGNPYSSSDTVKMRNWIQSNFLISLRTAETNLMARKKKKSTFSLCSLLVLHLAKVSSSLEETSSFSFRVQLRLTTLEFHFELRLQHIYFICTVKKFLYCGFKQTIWGLLPSWAMRFCLHKLFYIVVGKWVD